MVEEDKFHDRRRNNFRCFYRKKNFDKKKKKSSSVEFWRDLFWIKAYSIHPTPIDLFFIHKNDSDPEKGFFFEFVVKDRVKCFAGGIFTHFWIVLEFLNTIASIFLKISNLYFPKRSLIQIWCCSRRILCTRKIVMIWITSLSLWLNERICSPHVSSNCVA